MIKESTFNTLNIFIVYNLCILTLKQLLIPFQNKIKLIINTINPIKPHKTLMLIKKRILPIMPNTILLI